MSALRQIPAEGVRRCERPLPTPACSKAAIPLSAHLGRPGGGYEGPLWGEASNVAMGTHSGHSGRDSNSDDFAHDFVSLRYPKGPASSFPLVPRIGDNC
jgi:hypothetical protein